MVWWLTLNFITGKFYFVLLVSFENLSAWVKFLHSTWRGQQGGPQWLRSQVGIASHLFLPVPLYTQKIVDAFEASLCLCNMILLSNSSFFILFMTWDNGLQFLTPAQHDATVTLKTVVMADTVFLLAILSHFFFQLWSLCKLVTLTY